MTSQEWDLYWEKKNSIIYSFIASVYRKVILRPYLNHFMRKYVPGGSKVLHAGCGSGEVDKSRKYIWAVDYSPEAIRRYKINNPNNYPEVMDIKHMNYNDEFFDYIYNLGVMEHFTEDEIKQVLKEFHRVLYHDGKVILFWPPEFGLTVRILRFVQKQLKIKLHPDEPSLIKSKEQVSALIWSYGFKVVEYYFGPRDLWTQCVLVLEKQ